MVLEELEKLEKLSPGDPNFVKKLDLGDRQLPIRGMTHKY